MEDKELLYKIMKLEYLIHQMKHELDKYREIIHRMYMSHGSVISKDIPTITDSMEYDINKDTIGDYHVYISDKDDDSPNKLFCDIINGLEK